MRHTAALCQARSDGVSDAERRRILKTWHFRGRQKANRQRVSAYEKRDMCYGFWFFSGLVWEVEEPDVEQPLCLSWFESC